MDDGCRVSGWQAAYADPEINIGAHEDPNMGLE
jgi:hypothetical protein